MIKYPFIRSRRSEIVRACEWTASPTRETTYSEGANRLYSLERPYQWPFISDCSAGVTDMYRWALCPDPNGLNYKGDPYTGTLVAHGNLIAAKRVRSGDVGILGPGTGWHAVIALTGGPDPQVWSMGEQGDPRLYKASVVEQAVAYVNHVESCEVRWFRYDTSLAAQ
jgi:hypothetical protein